MGDLLVNILNSEYLAVHWLLQADNPHWLIIALILLLTLMDHVQTLTVLEHLIEC